MIIPKQTTLPPIPKFLSMVLLIAMATLHGLGQEDDLAEALQQLRTYDEGKNTRPLVVIDEQVHRLSHDAAQKRQLAGQLAVILQDAQTSPAAKLFICQQLRVVGGDAEVPLLARLLAEPETADPARLALQSMPGEQSGQALRSALDQAKGNHLIGIVNSLGERRERKAVMPLKKLLADSDAQVARAAATALGKIGTAESADALMASRPAERTAAGLAAWADAQMVCARQLAAAGNQTKAAEIYRKLWEANPPTPVRMAVLAGLAKTTPETALPPLESAWNSDESQLAGLALSLARELPGPQANGALTKAMANTTGQRRILFLGALAERGDRPALGELIKLGTAPDRLARADAQRELKRLRQASRDATVLEQIGAVFQAGGSAVVEVLSPPPYGSEAIAKRRTEAAKSLPPTDKLLVYLDCGVEAQAEENGVSLRQLNGGPWHYAGSEQAAAPPCGSVAFDGGNLRFQIGGLDPNKRYAIGVSWWDYDSNGRVQSATFTGGDPPVRQELARSKALPGYVKSKQGPAELRAVLDPRLYAKADGKLNLVISKENGPNAVVSELWVSETSEAYSAGASATTSASEPASPARSFLDPAWRSGTARILLVTGDDYPGHKWPQTAPVLAEILEKDQRLQVQIVESPNALERLELTPYKLVLLHFQNWEKPGPGPKARENLRQYVTNGGGLMLTHFACGAWFDEWPEFKNLAGRAWFGPNGGRQHDPHGKFTVEIADPDHPIAKGMKAFETIDELYTCLMGDAQIHVVARAQSKVDKKYYPMAFVLNYGKGRVFHTVLGHDVNAYTNHPAVGELMRRGCAWAAGLSPVP